jgi:hypothetical protein
MPSNETPLTLPEVLEQERKLEISKGLALENAFRSNDVNTIYQAQSYMKTIEQREVVNSKSLLIDPMELTSSFGYKDKPYQLSYDVLRAMSRTHIIKAIIETRKDQVLEFCEPQTNKYSTGFIIEKKSGYMDAGKEAKISSAERKKVEWMIEFLLECGGTSNEWHADTFDTFIGKLITDSLTLDQATFEIVRNRGGEPIEFFATDGATYRIADTFNDDENNTRHPEKLIQGYGPSYVQLYQGKVMNEFYPWELSFGVRNPQTDLRYNGYGRSELEDMIQTITAILNSDVYNANFFKVGSAPKGILRYSGNVNQNTLEDFRRQWQAQVAGAMNAHKLPIINADKMDFINTHIPNKDMEFSKYQEFLIKIACAIYKIDPSEIGFSMSGNSQGTSGLGGDNQKEKVQYSKDKGLKPILKKVQYWMNKFIVSQIDSTFQFKFVGVDIEADEQTELDRDIQSVTNFITLNELRAKRGLKPLPGGDMPLNPVYLQAQAMQQQKEQEAQGGGEGQDQQQDEDPFAKSLTNDLERLLSTED